MPLTTEKRCYKKKFSFDSHSLEEAHHFMIQTIIDHRCEEDMIIQCFFYTGKERTPCALIEFQRHKPKSKGLYGIKGQNEGVLLKKMLKWRGERDAAKPDVIGILIGKNLPIGDFRKFRGLVEASGVIVKESSLITGGFIV